MFKTIETARESLSDLLPSNVVDAIIPMLMSATTLEFVDNRAGDQLSFIGGAPIMFPDLSWPIPPVVDYNAIADRGGSTHREGTLASLQARQPYSFIGQIDLAKQQMPLLPDQGRLLFFYDVAVGPWDDSTRSGRVIWDQTPIDSVVEFKVPQALIDTEAQWNDAARNIKFEKLEFTDEMRQTFLDAGFNEADIAEMEQFEPDPIEHVDQAVFIGPKRHVVSTKYWQMPNFQHLEWDNFYKQLSSQISTPNLRDLLFDSIDELEIDETDWIVSMAMPIAEQDDPRAYAAIVELLGSNFPSREQVEENSEKIDASARKYKLLLQVPLSSWLNVAADGTVYFIIREDDLLDLNFNATIAVYQQT